MLKVCLELCLRLLVRKKTGATLVILLDGRFYFGNWIPERKLCFDFTCKLESISYTDVDIENSEFELGPGTKRRLNYEILSGNLFER